MYLAIYESTVSQVGLHLDHYTKFCCENSHLVKIISSNI